MVKRVLDLAIPAGFAILILISLAPSASAILAEVSLTELVQMSEHVVHARVLSTHSSWNADSTQIFTEVALLVDEKYAGRLADSSVVTVISPGGEVNGLMMEVEHAPLFQSGQEVIVFLKTIDGGRYRVSGWEAGKFTIRGGRVAENGMALAQFKTQIADAVRAAGPK